MPEARKKKAEEQAAEVWLRASYPDIPLDFEPDGSVPPDFLLRPSVAIEVRRLNETRIDPQTGRVVGHNEDDNRLSRFLERIFDRLPSLGGVQYHVHASLTDPASMRLDKSVTQDIERQYQKINGSITTTDHPGFRLEWTPWTPSAITSAVVLGSMMNDNSDGWLEHIYLDNLTRIVAEKTHKIIKNAVTRYPEWWLLLVDYIFPNAHFANRFDIHEVDKGLFVRIIIIDRNAGLVHEW